jgi:hypothetical protein
MLEELIKYVLPKEVINYFELLDIKTVGEELHGKPSAKAV